MQWKVKHTAPISNIPISILSLLKMQIKAILNVSLMRGKSLCNPTNSQCFNKQRHAQIQWRYLKIFVIFNQNQTCICFSKKILIILKQSCWWFSDCFIPQLLPENFALINKLTSMLIQFHWTVQILRSNTTLVFH